MRIATLFFLSLLAAGCGDGSPNNNLGPRVGAGIVPPSITALTPNTASVNAVPFTMTVDGENCGPDAIVVWNGTPQQTLPVSGKQLLANVTTQDVTFAGPAQVYVRTGGLNSNTVQFAVIP